MAQFALHTEVKHYIESGLYHLNTVKGGKVRKRTVRATAKDFIVKDGQLYYTGRNGTHRLVVMNTEQKEAVLRDCHENAETGRHQGQKRTFALITSSYYWIGISADVNQWIARCPQCKLKNTIDTTVPVLNTVKVTKPWTVLGLGLMGPFPVSLQGNSYVLTMADLFTKWVIAEPLKIKTAAEVAAVVINKLFDFGLVENIITDQEREFVDQVNMDMYKVLGVRRCLTSSYYPRSKGQLTRTNQTIKRALSKYCNDEQNDWDQHLKGVVYAINTSRQETTKYQPYFLMFNRNPLMPEIINNKSVAESEAGCFVIDNPELGTETRIGEATALHAKVLYSIEKAQGRRKTFSESRKRRNVLGKRKRVQSFHIHEGETVLLANKTNKGQKGGKLENDWIGPFLVKEISEKGLVTLTDESGKTRKTNVSNLKLYLKCDNESDGDHDYCVKAETDVTEADASECGNHTLSDIALQSEAKRGHFV